MRLHHCPISAVHFAAALLVVTTLGTPGLRAQGSSTADSAYDNGLSRASEAMPRVDPAASLRDNTPIPRPVFFPPEAPPLDLVVKRTPPRASSSRLAPSELTAYVREPFYPALAARLDRNQLSARKRDALQRYHDEKNLLQHNLRTELTHILAQPPAARGALLAALAQKQDPQILALEERAEDFRTDLFASDDAWTGARKPFITDTARAANDPEDISHVMLGAAFFQNGLSSAQRTMLREIAIEVMNGATSAAEAALNQPYVFFSPGPSRVMFPDELPASAHAKLADYQSKKSALRKELYDAIYREDATWFGIVRTARFKALADRQAPEFAALETLAEEIRRTLPPMPAPAVARALVNLPSTIVERIDALRQRQFAELREINRLFEENRAKESALRAITVYNPELHRYEFRRIFSNLAAAAKDAQEARPRFDALLDAYDRVDAALTGERNAIRRALAETLRTEDPARINLALADGMRQALEQTAAAAMKDCHVAVFEPGLSAAQRRLLFDYAVESLNLPLPGAVMQSTQRLDQSTASNDR